VRPRHLLRGPGLLRRSLAARASAQRARIPGLEFDRFGRGLGLRLIANGYVTIGAQYLLNPVSIVRYFEFPFSAESIPATARDCLDISSPRLFSLYWSSRHPGASVEMINPDPVDLDETRLIAKVGGIRIKYSNSDLRVLQERKDRYDAIWAISVLEHVHGSYDDRDSIAWIYSALRPGGVIVVTTPIDRQPWDEYREIDPYGLDKPDSGPVFFQRWYDLRSIHQRLLDPLRGASFDLAFFGETEPGMFRAYEAEWMRLGLRRSVDDPREIADHYREYASWEDMPGAGVCGIRIVKPHQDR